MCEAFSVNHYSQRVQVPNNWVLEFWVIVGIVQVSGKYMIIKHVDPLSGPLGIL